MLDLLSKYSVTQIIVFLVLCALAIKSVISFFDWAHDKIKQKFNKQIVQPEKDKQAIQNRLNQEEKIIKKLQQQQEKLYNNINILTEKINLLIQSDRDDIKSFITRQHHYFCYYMGWIDDYSLQCCEKRYQHYRDQGGNSFILGFMNELRALPKQAPQGQKENEAHVNR